MLSASLGSISRLISGTTTSSAAMIARLKNANVVLPVPMTQKASRSQKPSPHIPITATGP
jgi:hypothetical protein